MQGDDGHPHQPLVVRGVDGFGAIGMRCTTCHGKANFDPGGVPGNPVWHLAPIEMAWEGKSLGEICEQVKDRKRNGGKSMEEIIHHMGEDPLVGWGWNPGGGREPAPGTQEEFGELIKAWVDGRSVPASLSDSAFSPGGSRRSDQLRAPCVDSPYRHQLPAHNGPDLGAFGSNFTEADIGLLGLANNSCASDLSWIIAKIHKDNCNGSFSPTRAG